MTRRKRDHREAGRKRTSKAVPTLEIRDSDADFGGAIPSIPGTCTGIPVHTCAVHTTVVHVYTGAWEMGAWVHVVPGTGSCSVRRYLSAQVYLTVVS